MKIACFSMVCMQYIEKKILFLLSQIHLHCGIFFVFVFAFYTLSHHQKATKRKISVRYDQLIIEDYVE